MRLDYSEHPEATKELLEAVRRYQEVRAGLGDDFNSAVVAPILDIVQSPSSWPKVAYWGEAPEVRRRAVRGFPQRVLYYLRDGEVVIVAYAHERRRPGYWMRRIDG